LNSNSFVLFELVCFSKKEKERKIRAQERNPVNPKPQPGPAQTALENPTQIPQAGPFLSLKPVGRPTLCLPSFLPSRPSSRERKAQHAAQLLTIPQTSLSYARVALSPGTDEAGPRVNVTPRLPALRTAPLSPADKEVPQVSSQQHPHASATFRSLPPSAQPRHAHSPSLTDRPHLSAPLLPQTASPPQSLPRLAHLSALSSSPRRSRRTDSPRSLRCAHVPSTHA